MPLSREAEATAFQTLLESPKREAIVRVARAVICPMLRARKLDFPAPSAVVALAEQYEVGLASRTAFGDCLEVLMRPPESDAETALARALLAHAVVPELATEQGPNLVHLTSDLLWMATHSEFRVFGLLDVAIGERAPMVFQSLIELIREIDAGRGGGLGPAEALLAATAFADTAWPDASSRLAQLAREVRDPSLALVIRASATTASPLVLSGEVLPAERSPVATLLLGATGILAALHVLRLIARLALSARAHATVTVRPLGVHIVQSRTVFGRRFRTTQSVYPAGELVRVTSTSSEGRAGLLAMLGTFGLGSYLGMQLATDGVRGASPTLLARALLVIAVGFVLELAVSRVLPKGRGERVISLAMRDGKSLRIAVSDEASGAELLARYSV